MLDRAQLTAHIDALLEEQRSRCLWYVRADWRPANDAERKRALAAIKRHGDRVAFRRAAELERGLLRQNPATAA